jgi:DNA-binding SARP family transcriptional activator
MRVQLLGGFGVGSEGRERTRLPTARQQQLVAFLVLNAGHGAIPRQRVSGSLWPDSSDDQALTNLRRELHHLRETFPDLSALIDAGSRTLAWRGGARVTVDVLAFETAAARGLDGDAAALRDAAALYRGELLPDCTSEWIEGDRERLRQRATQVLRRLVQTLEHERAFAEAIERAEQLLRLDQLDEQAWCALMRCHAQRGERAAALHHYQRCAAVLKKELGIQPGAATRLTYREILELDAAVPATPEPPRTALYPLVGRQAEWAVLLNAWRTTAAGETRLAVIRGEAGIGKTRLAEELLDWCGVNGIATASARCYAFEGRLAYAPIADWVKNDALKSALMKLDAAYAADVARLCPELLAARREIPPPEPQLESWQRRRFFEALAQAFRSSAPLVLVLDDLQWADGDTLEWLQYFARAGAGARCLVVSTLRAEEEQDNPPLGRLLAHLERDQLLTTIALGPLDRTATALLAGEVTGQPLDEPALARTFRETEGHPLFIVERGRMALAGEPAAGGVLPHVQSVVAARLALLSPEARAAAEVAAAIGRDFRFDLLAQASDLEEPALVRALDELWRRHIVRVQSGERWDFSHDRIREVAYGEIGPARRRLIHRRIAQGMELLFADRLDEASASIAEHLADGGHPARAVSFLERAAASAMRLSAAEEAIRCLTQALALVAAQPAGPERDGRELALRSSLSVALNATHGYASPEVERNLERVFALLVPNGRGQLPVRWLWVAFTMRFMLGDLKGTREVSEQALALSAGDPSCRCEAHHAMGGMLLHVGELDASREHFDAAIAAYDEARTPRSALGSDLGVFTHAWSAHTVFLLGDDAAALERADQAGSLARRQHHAYSEALALAYAALLHQMRGDVERLLLCAEAAVALCDRHGIGYYGDWALALIGWAKGQSEPAAGIATIESAIEKLDRHRAQARRPYYLSLLADTYGRLGNTERAAAIVDAAIDMATARNDVWWLPALWLQKSEFERLDARDAALRQALALARAQHNRALERRIRARSAGQTVV